MRSDNVTKMSPKTRR